MGMTRSEKEDIFKMSQHVPRIQIDGKLSQPDLEDNRTIGLGLYVSKQIISYNDGILKFVSKKGLGSTFIFTFKLELMDYLENSKTPVKNEGSPFIKIEFETVNKQDKETSTFLQN